MTVVVDFVSRRTTAPFIMLPQPPTHGTNPNTTIVLEDITGPALKREGRYLRTTTTGRGRMCTMVNVDGVEAHLEVSLEIISDFETLRQQLPTNTVTIVTSIECNSTVVIVTLPELSASKIEPQKLFSIRIKLRNPILIVNVPLFRSALIYRVCA